MEKRLTLITDWQQVLASSRVVLESLSRWATYALVLLMPFSFFWPLGKSFVPGIFELYVSPGLYLSDLAVAVLLIIGLASSKERRWGPFEVSGPLLGLGVLALLTAPAALTPPLAGYMAIRWLMAFGVYVWFVQPHVPLERIVWLFVAGLCIHVPVALAQVYAQDLLGLPLIQAKSQYAMIALEGARWMRPYGLTFHPNVLGGYMAIGLLLSMPLLHRWSIRGAWWLLWVGLFISFSRSAWIAVALTIPIVTIFVLTNSRHGSLGSNTSPEGDEGGDQEDQDNKGTSLKARRQALAVAFFGAGIVLLACSIIWHKPLAVRLEPITGRFDQISMNEMAALIGVATATPSPIPSATVTSTAISSATATISQVPSSTQAVAAALETATALPTSSPTIANTATPSPTPIAPLATADSTSTPTSTEAWSWYWRQKVFAVAIGVIMARPWYGVGAGNSVLVMPYNFSPTHQVPLMLANEVGVLGGALWISLCLTVAFFLIRYWRRANSWGVALIAAWLALAVIGLFDFYPWGLNSGHLLTVMVSGLMVRSLEIGD